MTRTSAVLCRVDAGGARGLGHLQRCLSLSQAFRERHVPAVFVAPPIDEVEGRTGRAGFTFVPLPVPEPERGGPADRTFTLDVAREHGCEVVVLDSYEFDDGYRAALREAGHFVVAIDDLAAQPFSAHVVVNSAAGAEERRYQTASGDTVFLLGPRYALLGREYWSVPPRAAADRVGRVLVTVGGGDSGGHLMRILDVLDTRPEPFEVVAVEGPFSAASRGHSRNYRHGIEYVRAPDNLYELMMTADLAVSAAGQTLYELAATGTPTVAVRLYDNQHENLRHLSAAGAVCCGGCIDEPDFETRLGAALARMIEAPAERVRIGRTGQQLVDGRGVFRVAEAVCEARRQASGSGLPSKARPDST